MNAGKIVGDIDRVQSRQDFTITRIILSFFMAGREDLHLLHEHDAEPSALCGIEDEDHFASHFRSFHRVVYKRT